MTAREMRGRCVCVSPQHASALYFCRTAETYSYGECAGPTARLQGRWHEFHPRDGRLETPLVQSAETPEAAVLVNEQPIPDAACIAVEDHAASGKVAALAEVFDDVLGVVGDASADA